MPSANHVQSAKLGLGWGGGVGDVGKEQEPYSNSSPNTGQSERKDAFMSIHPADDYWEPTKRSAPW